ncbi:MAG: 50S ribosomal protein L3 [Elusimicrobia bacterium CG_4_9_14_3_um_filter_62_55]|nr:MAG: 50S ribosomal protein L3 [Elusimicrobia bacterium CG22_combo_CG10-13_8_21_14_all_63_91]PJA12535.1 MAG: 50S ribosomal protein L3 [Elusimicrobia bacterium CG_4_10_14_0_2_um_filter_63_34]PJB25291.1 MAG: 50S ribosomal protein L3 [Elusimicrobia bacterium CG_4_9_14_3_um_filter_62_55]
MTEEKKQADAEVGKGDAAPIPVEAKADEKAAGPAKAPETFRVVLGEKVGMTQVYTPAGELKAVTALRVGPCPVLGVKTKDGKDGYNAVVLGYGERREKNVNKADGGRFKKAGVKASRLVREFRVADAAGFEMGQWVTVQGRFASGDYVDVQATSKGKGFASTIKRWDFGGGRRTHGAQAEHRAPGSLTGRRSLGRVMPGKKMGGHMGQETITVQKVEVIEVDAANNTIYLNGSVPGARGSFVTIQETVKKLKKRKEAQKAKGPKKDKMGNIIQEGGKKGKK